MRILLQDVANLMYVRRFGKRTADPSKAFPFPHTLAAVRYQRAHPMDSLQIVLHWDEGDEAERVRNTHKELAVASP